MSLQGCVLLTVLTFACCQALLGLDEGETCKNSGDEAWTCTTLKNCSHIDVRVLRPSICRFRGRDPIICCPPRRMSKAEMSCKRYSEMCSNFIMFRGDPDRANQIAKNSDWTEIEEDEALVIQSLGIAAGPSSTGRPSTEERPKQTLAPAKGQSEMVKTESGILTPDQSGNSSVATGRQVVGGHLSLPRVQRHMALIGYGPADDKTWLCGGSIVSELWVLSAAHCSDSGSIGAAKWARFGDLDYESNTDDARPQDRRIVRRINHPDYKPPQIYHDLALFKLDSPVVFDQYVAPICLHTLFEISEPKATVVGWGRTGFVEEVSNKLLEADITLIEHSECSRLFGSGDQSTPRGVDRMAMLCAGEKEGGKDACSGDSGGPLVVNQPGTCLKKQVGITSFGRDCGLPNTPGIYTRVSTYVPWIESIVWP